MGTKMFKVGEKKVETWNPITGCSHNCTYCWARDLALGKLKHLDKYKDGFKPAFHTKTLKQSLGKNKVYFVVSMGDMWAIDVDIRWVAAVLRECIKADKSNTFMFLTKNPDMYPIYFNLPGNYKDNFILGATIESDIHHTPVSDAPPPKQRYKAMSHPNLKSKRKFLSIEPIINFNKGRFAEWVIDINPEFIYIGYDNYKSGLIEPPLDKTMELIEELRDCGIEVRTKTLREAHAY